MQIGVIGTGVMGNQIAAAFAEKGYMVLITDNDYIKAKKALKKIYRDMLINGMAANKNQDLIQKQHEAIHGIQELEQMRTCDVVVECITEDIELKEKLYLQLSEICREDCIFFSNTSCISITKLASFMKHPDKVIGTHFMNPVRLIKGVEVIRGFYTSDSTIEFTKNLLLSLDKESISVNDFPGFVSNRISHMMINEAAFIVQDGVASPETVDDVFIKCYGHKTGPLKTADIIGIDTVVKSLNVLYESYQDQKFRCCPLLVKMMDAGCLGEKSKKGFYQYD